jgi:quercetin dioxygenase-like cupin family protein
MPSIENTRPRHFVTLDDAIKEEFKGRTNYWLCRPEIVAAEGLQICQATLPPGEGHAFHVHPELEEALYVLGGEIEQWVETESRVLLRGDLVHIPRGRVHATFNAGLEDAVILAVLSPAAATGPFLVDMSAEEPWRSIRGLGRC